MPGSDPILGLQRFVDERGCAARSTFYPDAAERLLVHREVTRAEAEYFLAAVTARGDEAPLVEVDCSRKMRSDRFPPLSNGRPRGYLFFEEPGRLKLETIVHISAAARLRDEFGWPRHQIVLESPAVLDDDGTPLLHQLRRSTRPAARDMPTPARG
jgi:hypothetical protein